jgi:hypothetical protein
MGEETRHRTVIEFAADDAPMESVLQRMESRINAIADRAAGMFGGGPGSGGGGVGGMPVAPPAPSSPLLFPGGGGAGSPMAPAAPASPLLYGPDNRPLVPGAAPSLPIPFPALLPPPPPPPSPAAYAPQGGASGPGGMPGGGGSSAAYDAYWEGMNADREGRNARRIESDQQRMANRSNAYDDMGAMTRAAANGVIGMSPAAPVMAATALGTSYFGRKAEEYREAGQTGTARMLGTTAAAMGIFGGAAVAALGMRYGIAQERGSSDLMLGQADVAGMRVDLAGAAGLGYRPTEAAGIAQGFASAAGFDGAGSQIRSGEMFRLARLGVSPGAVGSYAGQFAPGAGGWGTEGGLPAPMAAQAFSSGLRGSGVERWLQTIANHTRQIADGGLEIDLDKSASFLAKLRGTPGLAEEAARLPGIVTGLDGARMGVRQRLLGGAGSLVDAAAMDASLDGAKTYEDVLRNNENLSGEQILRRTVGLGGKRGAVPALMDKLGIPYSAAAALAGELGEPAEASMPNFPGGRSAIASTLARGDQRRMASMGTSEAVELVKGVETMATVVNNLGEVMQAFLHGLWVIASKLGADMGPEPGGPHQ